MMQCSRFYTDQNFKKRVIISSCSLRNLKWGEKNNDEGRKSVVESTSASNKKLFNNNFKILSNSNSTEKDKKDINLNEEEEQKRKEELSRKREMSYRARKRIILRMRGIPEEKEQKTEDEKENNNKKQKIKRIEINLPVDNFKFKRINSNNIICNNKKCKNNEFEILDNYNTNIDNQNYSRSIIDNFNNDCKINKNIKNNYVVFRNIRNIYKKNLIKDISVLTDKNCKILKVKKNFNDKKKGTYKDEKFNIHINNNITKKNSILNKEKKEKINNDYRKKKNNDNKINEYTMLKYLDNQKNKKIISNNIDKKTNNDINDIYYSLNISKKNLNRINSDFLEQKKIPYFHNVENEIDINDIKINENKSIKNINNRKKTKKNRMDNSEKRSLYNFSIFKNFPPKPNKISKEMGEEMKNSGISKTFKLETHSQKTFKKERMSNNVNMINLRILSNNHLNNNKFNSIESEILENNEIKKVNTIDIKFYIIYFFEELIDISNSMDNKNLLATLLNNFNQKYFIINDINFDKEYLHFIKQNENFEYIYKHFGLVLICLIFLSKDEILYKEYNLKVRDLLLQLIFSSLNYVEIYGNKESNKINNFINNNNFKSVIPNHRYILSLIYLLFNNKKEYLPLKDALEQIHNIIIKRDFQFIMKVINESILFCYNSKPKCLFNFPFFAFKNNVLTLKNNQDKQNNDINFTNNNITNKNNICITNNKIDISTNNLHHNNNISNISTNNIPNNNISNISASNFSQNYNLNNENMPTVPFIKSTMKKKFCLVLDIDETISHSLKLSFGCYFLLRPGARDFLKEVSKYYEIIIFTSSPKKYADKILNKIDIDGDLISYRLYRSHVLYENGKSIKNLNLIGRDLTKTIFVDNLRSNAKYNLNNLCPITTWRSDIFDNKLIKLKDKLIYLATCGKYDDDITQGL